MKYISTYSIIQYDGGKDRSKSRSYEERQTVVFIEYCQKNRFLEESEQWREPTQLTLCCPYEQLFDTSGYVP
jgi:hypothetical protein